MKAESLLQLAPHERMAIEQYVDLIRDRFPERVVSVALFGSKARGDATAESDIDVMVLVDADDRAFRSDLWRIASDVSLEYNVVLSVRVYAQARWAEAQRIRLPVYRAIAADMVPLTPQHVPV